MKRFALAFTALAFSAGISGSAHACSSGFIADVFCQAGVIDQNTANTLDGINAQGKFVERGVATVLDSYVGPGAGEAYLMTQGIGSSSQMGSPMGLFPQPQASHASQLGLTPLPSQHISFGNVCATINGGFYPGPMNPIGTPCTALGPWGPEPGQVISW